MKPGHRVKLLVWSSVAVTATFAVVHASTVLERRDRLQQIETQVAQMPAREAEERQLIDRISELEDQIARNEAGIEGVRGVAHLLALIMEDLTELDILERSVTTGATSADGVFLRVPVTLEFSASFASSFAILKRLESHSELIRLRRIEIERVPDSIENMVFLLAEFDAWTSASSEDFQ